MAMTDSFNASKVHQVVNFLSQVNFIIMQKYIM